MGILKLIQLIDRSLSLKLLVLIRAEYQFGGCLQICISSHQHYANEISQWFQAMSAYL